MSSREELNAADDDTDEAPGDVVVGEVSAAETKAIGNYAKRRVRELIGPISARLPPATAVYLRDIIADFATTHPVMFAEAARRIGMDGAKRSRT